MKTKYLRLLKGFRTTILLIARRFVFILNAALFFLPFGVRNPFLLRPSRTLGITLISFTLTYYLMSRVYGGFDIGKKKDKPIIYAISLSCIGADLVAHLFLSIMNVTVVHGGKFVYEQPLLLLAVILVQILVTVLMTRLCNMLYFKVNKPQSCVAVHPKGEPIEAFLKKVGRFAKQYRIDTVLESDSPALFGAIDRHDAVFLYEVPMAERTAIADYCFQMRKDIYYSVELPDIIAMGGERVLFDDQSMIYSSVKTLSPEQRFLKRSMDLVLSGFAVLILSPLMLGVALAIKLEDGGEVFYKQPRATDNGRHFLVYKFRSMRETVGGIHKSVTVDDDRITRVGRFIRKYRIDELPQFFNILKGEMSVVGPRPEMLENVEKYTDELPEFVYRLRMKAGLTGMAQIYGKYNTSPKDKLILDLTYMEQYSIWLDVKMILRTLLVLLKPDESTEAFENEK